MGEGGRRRWVQVHAFVEDAARDDRREFFTVGLKWWRGQVNHARHVISCHLT